MLAKKKKPSPKSQLYLKKKLNIEKKIDFIDDFTILEVSVLKHPAF
jgi:hypothetical protein